MKHRVRLTDGKSFVIEDSKLLYSFTDDDCPELGATEYRQAEDGSFWIRHLSAKYTDCLTERAFYLALQGDILALGRKDDLDVVPMCYRLDRRERFLDTIYQ